MTQIIENDKLAAKEEVPLCQDTGMAILFVEYGDKVVIEDGSKRGGKTPQYAAFFKQKTAYEITR